MIVERSLLIGTLLTIIFILSPTNGSGHPPPDFVTIDSLVQYYERVNFDHAKHVGMSTDCAQCHHHTTGTAGENSNCRRCHKDSGATTVVACRGCHAAKPFSAEAIKQSRLITTTYHKDKPGLRGAYHQSCRKCHVEKGGPTECQGCHARNKEGDRLFNAAKDDRKLK